jgi:predicted secreted protein
MAILCGEHQGMHALHATSQCTNCMQHQKSVSFPICEPCAEEMECCQFCLEPIEEDMSTPQTKGVFFVRKGDKDNGGNVSLKTGEEVHITLPEDSHTGQEWVVDDYTFGLLDNQSRGTFVPDPGDYQYGTRTFVFSARRSGTGEIKLVLTARFGGRSSTTWKANVKVK